ncbi:MAG TPA: S8 family serine peptidase [Candidatus Limnocylindrales bacterium]|nr:S8 family serine peptidase [Candidatus Limnocylindrales bacterium]
MRIPFSAFVTLTVVGVSSLVGLTANPAHAACQREVQPGAQISDTPWHLQLWNLSTLPPGVTGKGIRVAVLDSGVDPNHPQLQGKVVANIDKLHGVATPEDCNGHGTGVAGLIAASIRNNVPFRGLAPGAQILAARVSEQAQGNEDNTPPVPITEMAATVDWAVENGAKVINMSFVYTNKSEGTLAPFKEAVTRAIDKGVVVVAAAGNLNDKGNPTPYPAAWPGVVGVAAIGANGFQKLPQSQIGTYVDIAAPGVEVWAPRPGSGFAPENGTSFAAPMVAATAALIFDRFKDDNITGQQVVKRLLATADPSPGGRASTSYGVGIVNPIRAVTDIVDDVKPQPAKALRGQEVDEATLRAEKIAAERRQQSLWVAGIVGVGVILATVLMTALPVGIRRRWRPAGK